MQDNCSESGSLHTVPKQSCCDRKVSHLCLYCSGAEEMAVEQVDCFNYAGNGPWGFWSGNLRTSKSFQKHPNLEHTTFLVNLQQRAARSCRMLLKPTCCKCAFFSGGYSMLQQLEGHWNVWHRMYSTRLCGWS